MGTEHMNFPAASDPERMEAAGFLITIRPTEHPDWVTMSLGREGINYEVDVNRQTGEIYGSIRVDMGHSADHELVKRRTEDIPEAIRQTLGITEATVQQSQDDRESMFGSTPGRRATKEHGGPEPDLFSQ